MSADREQADLLSSKLVASYIYIYIYIYKIYFIILTLLTRSNSVAGSETVSGPCCTSVALPCVHAHMHTHSVEMM